jgi:divalent metal cation (Fe/Co/Zn/Cd) transporter
MKIIEGCCMDYIRKLPLLMALSGAIITGLVGYTHQVQNNENMTNMIITMIIFYIIGLLIRGTVLDIIETIRKKEEEKIKEEKRIAEEKEKEEKNQKQKAENASGSTLNLVVDEDLNLGMSEDEFNDLPVADYIKSELRK